ncbi:Spo0E family sporulation regulatory protein-aspartic acid phosphatase [Paenibacillus sepulcri]|uniref:Aspartyl-phosphate phosphatase Spo0E family protein n=1 Tax=Paenibacillus sepulcri TaxID=359917 RepID=A0ABS7C180_9BACL|nr:aspartyl-phosphate phosphatase Spo0E family protein [Paenibacillus sepulcri]
MAFADYGLSFNNEPGTVSARQLSSSIQSLEAEIYALRTKMEQSYTEETTFNSDIVIDLSRRLDLKINEYMHVMRKKSKSS